MHANDHWSNPNGITHTNIAYWGYHNDHWSAHGEQKSVKREPNGSQTEAKREPKVNKDDNQNCTPSIPGVTLMRLLRNKSRIGVTPQWSLECTWGAKVNQKGAKQKPKRNRKETNMTRMKPKAKPFSVLPLRDTQQISKNSSYENCSHFWDMVEKMFKNIFNIWSNMQKDTQNPINVLKITIYCTKYTNNANIHLKNPFSKK